MLLEGSDDARYVVVFDPLDGSSNIDASIPTGECFSAPFLLFRFCVRWCPDRVPQRMARAVLSNGHVWAQAWTHPSGTDSFHHMIPV